MGLIQDGQLGRAIKDGVRAHDPSGASLHSATARTTRTQAARVAAMHADRSKALFVSENHSVKIRISVDPNWHRLLRRHDEARDRASATPPELITNMFLRSFIVSQDQSFQWTTNDGDSVTTPVLDRKDIAKVKSNGLWLRLGNATTN